MEIIFSAPPHPVRKLLSLHAYLQNGFVRFDYADREDAEAHARATVAQFDVLQRHAFRPPPLVKTLKLRVVQRHR
jgi:hypothetical protein